MSQVDDRCFSLEVAVKLTLQNLSKKSGWLSMPRNVSASPRKPYRRGLAWKPMPPSPSLELCGRSPLAGRLEGSSRRQAKPPINGD